MSKNQYVYCMTKRDVKLRAVFMLICTLLGFIVSLYCLLIQTERLLTIICVFILCASLWSACSTAVWGIKMLGIFKSDASHIIGFLVPTSVLDAYITKNTKLKLEELNSFTDWLTAKSPDHNKGLAKSLAFLSRLKDEKDFKNFVEFTKSTNKVLLSETDDESPLLHANYYYRVKKDDNLEVFSIEYI